MNTINMLCFVTGAALGGGAMFVYNKFIARVKADAATISDTVKKL